MVERCQVDKESSQTSVSSVLSKLDRPTGLLTMPYSNKNNNNNKEKSLYTTYLSKIVIAYSTWSHEFQVSGNKEAINLKRARELFS